MLNMMIHQLKKLKIALKRKILPLFLMLSLICPMMMMFPIRAKATGTYYNYGDQEITYDGYLYGFYLNGMDASGLPQNYKISSDVFENLIESNAKGFQIDLASRIDTRGIIIAEWALNGVENYCNFVYGLYTNAYQALGSFSHDFIWRGTTTYSWNYYFTGADPNYPGNSQYGTAYGFRFIGACGDIFDFVLDENGDFYGHSVIGNWTPSEDPEPTDWILINQGLDNFYTPSIYISTFDDLTPPYIEGKSLHYFVKSNGVETSYIVEDFTNTLIGATVSSSRYDMWFFSDHNLIIYEDIYVIAQGVSNSTYKNNTTFWPNAYDSLHYYATYYRFSPFSFNLPYYPKTTILSNPTYNGVFNQTPVSGNNYIFLKGFSYSPVTNPQPMPEYPVPITSIPENPEDPIPQSNPEPVPGIIYPEPPVIPLPPFATIVSGNDDLWGNTIELQNIELDLLPYLGSLSEFEFPSFTDLFDEYTASIIWVAQIMSLLYNGTPLNILFIALCLFSLVSVLIGAYKLWTGTEPDPENGGRRWKRPPKGGKRH